MGAISFSIDKRSGKARAGVLHTPSGDIKTPAFIPVGTKAAVKGVDPETLKGLGAQVVLANTYHLYLSPSESVVQEAGGLAKFMGVDTPTVTDSGGFQVFSLGKGMKRKITRIEEEDKNVEQKGTSVFDEDVASQHGQLAIIDEEGVTFTSHIDGSLHRLTPERSVEIQHALGADFFFAFDECTSPTDPYDYQKEAMFRTHRWADRSLKAHRQNLEANKKQGIYGIGQGGQFEDLRRESTKTIGSMGFDGFGLGGAFNKVNGESMLPLALACLEELSADMPVHGLGVGEPGDLLLGIANGVDTFDCVAPTRHGRHGTIYTRRGPINLSNEKYVRDFSPLDPETVVKGTEKFTKAYVCHLLRNNEILGQVIASIHNLGFIIGLVDGAREAILNGTFEQYRADFERDYYGK
ncbi:MAG: tRNA-guanine transglycosylase [Parcubacteria bacterium C7867-001]|nr:MAG: tRNA-guanine transglycosylase [Parcubacteria bacterium C7867-001]